MSRLDGSPSVELGGLQREVHSFLISGENKLASGFNCTGFCVLVDSEPSKCGAKQKKMVSGFHEQAAEAAVLW